MISEYFKLFLFIISLTLLCFRLLPTANNARHLSSYYSRSKFLKQLIHFTFKDLRWGQYVLLLTCLKVILTEDIVQRFSSVLFDDLPTRNFSPIHRRSKDQTGHFDTDVYESLFKYKINICGQRYPLFTVEL